MNAFLKEVHAQPAALDGLRRFYAGAGADLLAAMMRVARENKTTRVLLSGMGSSLFAAYPALRFFSERGMPASMIETSELLHYHVGGVPTDALVFLVSQSGETIETERLLQRIPGRERLIAVTNVPGSTLGRAGAVTLPIQAGSSSVGVSARSYHNMMATLLLAAESLTGGGNLLDKLGLASNAMEEFLKGADGLGDSMAEFVGNPSSTSILARGPSLATAHQSAFNLKELARFPAEPMSAAQFRHGPIEIAAQGHLCIVFAPLGSTFTLLRKLSEELLGFGTRVVLVTDTQESLRHRAEGFFAARHPRLDEDLAPLVNLLPIQLLAASRAEQQGLEPGQLSKASAVQRVE